MIGTFSWLEKTITPAPASRLLIARSCSRRASFSESLRSLTSITQQAPAPCVSFVFSVTTIDRPGDALLDAMLQRGEARLDNRGVDRRLRHAHHTRAERRFGRHRLRRVVGIAHELEEIGASDPEVGDEDICAVDRNG